MDIAPPLQLVLSVIGADVRQAGPDGALAAAEPIAQAAVLDLARAAIAKRAAIWPISGMLDYHGIAPALPPVRGQVERVIGLAALVFPADLRVRRSGAGTPSTMRGTVRSAGSDRMSGSALRVEVGSRIAVLLLHHRSSSVAALWF